MGVKYVKDFSFPSAGGFHSGSVQRYAKGGHVTKLPAKAKDSAKGMPARAKPNAPARGAPKMESKPKVGKGQGYEKGGRVPGREMDRLPTKRPPGRGKDLAPARRFKGKYEGYAEGGPVDEILPGDGRGGLEIAMPTRNVERFIEERDLPPLMPEEYDRLPQANLEQRPLGDLRPLPEEPNYGGMTTNLRNPLVAKPQDYDPGLKNKKFLDSLLPEEPNYLVPLPQEPINRPPQPDYGSMPVGVMGGGDEYWRKGGIKDQQAERTRQWYISNGLTPPGETAPRGAVGKLLMPEEPIYGIPQMRPRPEPVDRVGNRRAMMGDRRDMAMRPGMRGVARREAPPRMRAPEPQPYMRNQMPVLKPFSPEEIAEYSKGKTFSPEGRFAKGGEVRSKKIAKVMREYKKGELHSGSKKGPVVKNPKQAMAIALSEARAAKKAAGGAVDRDYDDVMKKFVPYESKGPKTRYTAAKGRRMAKERAMERRALDKARHAEKYAPGMSLDMSEYKKGGKVKHSDVKMDKAMVKKAVHKHERAMHPGKPMTKLNKGGVPSYGRKAMYGGGKC